MMRKDSRVNETFWNAVPKELVKALEVEAKINGIWQTVGKKDKNQRRLIKFTIDQIEASAIRIRLKETYGKENARLYEVRCYEV